MDGTTPAPRQGGYAFITYNHKDLKYVQRLERYLDDQGIRYWRDHEIPPAQRWHTEIERRLRESSAVIVVQTPSAKRSTYVENEIRLALTLGLPIFALLLDGERFFQLDHLQGIDVRGGKMPPVGELRRILGAARPPAPTPTRSLRVRWAFGAVAVAAVAGLIGTLATVGPLRGDRSAQPDPSTTASTTASATGSPDGATWVTLNVEPDAYICMRQYIYGEASAVPDGSVVRLFVGDSPGPYFPAEEPTYYDTTHWHAFVQFGEETTGAGTPYRLHAVVLAKSASDAIGGPLGTLPGTEYASVDVLRKLHNPTEEPCAAP